MRDDFIDTNIIVYLLDDTDERRKRVAEDLLTRAVQDSTAQISFQVVTEALYIVTTRIADPLDLAGARDFYDNVLKPLWHVHPSDSIYHRALAVRVRYQLSYWDSLIMAAAIEGGCSRILTEDLTHGQRIEGVLIHNPFR